MRRSIPFPYLCFLWKWVRDLSAVGTVTNRAMEGVFAEEGQLESALKKGHFGGDAAKSRERETLEAGGQLRGHWG